MRRDSLRRQVRRWRTAQRNYDGWYREKYSIATATRWQMYYTSVADDSIIKKYHWNRIFISWWIVIRSSTFLSLYPLSISLFLSLSLIESHRITTCKNIWHVRVATLNPNRFRQKNCDVKKITHIIVRRISSGRLVRWGRRQSRYI